MAVINFDASKVAPQRPRSAIPTNWYTVCIIDSQVKPTSKKTGYMLELVYKVQDGEFAGATLYDRINFQNKSKQAEDIGQAQLSAICHAVGHIMVGDSTELHGRPLDVRVVLVPPSVGDDGKQYDESNEVKDYRAAASGITTGAAPMGPSAAAMAWAGQPQQAPAFAAPHNTWAQDQVAQNTVTPLAPQQPAPAFAQPAPAPWAAPAPGVAPAQPQGAQQSPPWQQPAPAAQPPQAPQQAPAAPWQQSAPQAPQQPAGAGAMPPWMQQ